MSDMPAVTVSMLDLAALLCSRVCHDVIGPVGAVVNGVEVLEDEDTADMKEMALELIAKSARQAAARLKFTRLAFGAAGSMGAQLDLGDAEQVVRGMIEDQRTTVDWNLPRAFQPKNKVKLLLNLVLLSTTTIPRGGTIRIAPIGEGEEMGLLLEANGVSARIPQGVEALVACEAPEGGLDAHSIQPFYAGLLARECALKVSFAQAGDTVTLTALAA